ncbi:Zinc finger protein SNAI3 [Frankliniella fusca]|uniref:Zinc finger protein SNAI3 n=1 Tax=Frankliniella fusca TaxID=407009 RepID=A0AAE1HZE2_9NEOP|nr:Zinc finger protein SNAI3 [Frankliniella fusca]
MGDSTTAWRARIGLFCGGSKKRRKSLLCSGINKFWATVSLVFVLLSVALSSSGSPLTGSELPGWHLCKLPPVLPIASCNAFSSAIAAIVLLVSTHLDCEDSLPTRDLQNKSHQHDGENCLLLVVFAAAISFILLFRGGVELNPGPYPCRLCSVVPETITSNVRHQLFHSRNRGSKYYCPACEFRSSSYGSLNFHVSTQHRGAQHIDPAATEKIFCSLKVNGVNCNFSTTSLWLLVQHLCAHIKEDNLTIQCPISGCEFKKKFVKIANFRSHLSVWHKNWRDEGCPLEVGRQHKSVNSPQNTPMLSEEFSHSCEEEILHLPENGVSNDDSHSDILDDSLILDSIGKFYLQMYALNLLPQETIQDICNNLIFLTEVIHARIKLILSRELKALDSNISEDKIKQVCMKVLEADLLYLCHHKTIGYPTFTSDHLRKKYFKSLFGYEEPKQINLEPADPSSKNTLQYVSITQSLNTLLKDSSVQQEINATFEVQHKLDPDEISNYTDGELFKSENHPPKEIHLNLYQGSFNPVLNALGSAKNKFKDLVVYFNICNLRPHLRSLVDSKQLVLICRESVFKKFGTKKCFEELMSELRKLESTGVF